MTQTKPMPCLSVRQPWATLICQGFPVLVAVDNDDGSQRIEWNGRVVYKDIENRSRPTSYRGRIYVHAATKWAAGDTVLALMKIGVPPIVALLAHSSRKDLVPRGAIIGEVDIVDCISEDDVGDYPWCISPPTLSPWFEGPFGWVLANPVLYPEPIPYRGRLGLFAVELPERTN